MDFTEPEGIDMYVTIRSSAVILAALALLSACETTEGVGRDISKGGNDITQSAEKHNPSN